jgi:HK97 family phage major capsid protein
MDNASEEIQSLEIQRGQLMERAATVEAIATESSREMTGEESASFGNYLDKVEAIDAKISRAARIESLSIARAKAAPEVEADPVSRISLGDQRREPGMLFTQLAIAMHRNGNNASAAAEYATRVWDDPLLARVLSTPPDVLQRAAIAGGNTTAATWAAELVEYRNASEEFVEMLRPISAVMQLSTRTLDFGRNDSITIPTQTAGAAGGYIAEGAAIPVGLLATGQITMAPRHLGIIVAITEQLANSSAPDALSLIRDDMIQGTATAIDAAALTQTARSATVPGGIYTGGGTAAGALVGAVPAVLDRITADTLAAQQSLSTANVSGALVWIMNSSEYNMLTHVRDGIGQYAFREELSRGMFIGHRVVVSNNQPTTNVGLIAENQLIMGRKGGPAVATSADATINMSDAPVVDMDGATDPVTSMFQTRQIALRLTWDLDYVKRHAAASYEITAADWS